MCRHENVDIARAFSLCVVVATAASCSLMEAVDLNPPGVSYQGDENVSATGGGGAAPPHSMSAGGEGGLGDAPCQSGLTWCTDGCVDLSVADDHCGTCDNACESNEACDGNGTCVRPWEQVHPKATIQDMHGVHFIDSTKGWAVGGAGTIVYTVDGGVTWLPQAAPTTKLLRDVVFVTDSRGWAVGDGGTILDTDDGGQSWKVQQAGEDYALRAVSFADENNGWSVSEGGRVLHTTDGGSNWLQQTSSVKKTLNDVHFTSADTGWAVGDEGVILHTTDGGSEWKKQESTVETTLHAVVFQDANNGWAVGEDGVILHTTDGGGTWASQASRTVRDLHAVHFVSNSVGYVAGAMGGLGHTTDSGGKWEGQGSVTKHTVAIAHFISAERGWAVDRHGVVVNTVDGGVSWSSAPSPVSSNFQSPTMGFVHFVDHARGFLGSWSQQVGRTTDQGSTWPEVYDVADRVADGAFINTENNWIVGENGYVAHSGDDGKTWQTQGQLPSPDVDLTSVEFSDAYRGVIVGQSATGGVIWIWNGQTWNAKHETDKPLTSVSFADKDVVVAVGAGGTVVRSKDGGEDWAPVSSAAIGTTSLQDVCLTPNGFGWAVGSSYIFKTVDGGETWEKQAPGTKDHLYTVHCIDDETAYVTGRYGLVLKTTVGGAIPVP